MAIRNTLSFKPCILIWKTASLRIRISTTPFSNLFLQPDAPFTQIEQDFWASADPDSSLFDWKFPDPPHTKVFLSAAVRSGAEAVTYVSHDIEDGAWQFLGDGMAGGQLPLVSCFHHPIDRDRSLEELADLPLGWWAERTAPGQPWVRYKAETEPEPGSGAVVS